MKVGGKARFTTLDPQTRSALVKGLESEASRLLQEKIENYPDTLSGKTLVIEFARGGAQGSKIPLASPFGYQYSIGRLSEAILKNASVLYIAVTPEESRRKNEARADPNNPGSILHHGVPIHVMLNDYGCDDMDWLMKHSRKPNTLTIEAHGKHYDLPFARFDNEKDKTSFIRGEHKEWKPAEIKAVHDGLKAAFEQLSRLDQERR